MSEPFEIADMRAEVMPLLRHIALAKEAREKAMSNLRMYPAWSGVADACHALEKELVATLGRIEHRLRTFDQVVKGEE